MCEAREKCIEEFTDELLSAIRRAILKAGGNYEEFESYIRHKEIIGEIDTALHLAFGSVKEIKYLGCF